MIKESTILSLISTLVSNKLLWIDTSQGTGRILVTTAMKERIKAAASQQSHLGVHGTFCLPPPLGIVWAGICNEAGC